MKARKQTKRFLPRDPTRTALARNMRRLRMERGLNQGEVARLSDVTQSQISMIEGGRIPGPRIETLKKIAKAIGVTLDQLCGR